MPQTTSIEFRYATFSPAELEAITGVPQATQRNWRRYNYLTKKKSSRGRERFALYDVAQILAARALMARSRIELKHAMDAAKVAAVQIVDLALDREAARFVVVLGTGDWMSEQGGVLRTDDLGAVKSRLDRYLKRRSGDLDAATFIAIDCKHLAIVLAEHAGKPLCERIES
jgi:hypothetical protein